MKKLFFVILLLGSYASFAQYGLIDKKYFIEQWFYTDSLPYISYDNNIGLQPNANLSNLTKLEYFIDIDPGIGNGISVSVTPSPDITQNINIALNNISNGMHTFYVRVKDANGKWSLTNTRLFYHFSTKDTSLRKLEYFIDIDPGFGNGNQVTFSPASNITKNFTIPLTTTSEGFHTLYIRAKQSNGSWSIVQSAAFYRMKNEATQISKLEYFIDADPGLGMGIDIPVVQPSLSISQSFIADLSCYPVGEHIIYFRVRDNDGKWSLTNIEPIIINYMPPFITIIGSTSLCEGETVLLKVPSTAGRAYQWLRNGTLISGAIDSMYIAFQSGAYQAIINHQNICQDTTSIVQINVSPLPGTAGTITGSAIVCQGQNNVNYSVPVISNATGYVWSVPAGANIVSGNNSNSITINFSSMASSGNISVYGTNDCGNGTVSSPYYVTVNPCGVTVSGTVTYPNTNNTPLDNVTVSLIASSGSIVSTTTTNVNGNYSFTGVATGNYSLNVSIYKPWGGVSAADVLLYKKYIAGISVLNGIFLASGDVNGSGGLSASDVLLIKKRIANVISSFIVGDWLFNNQPFTVGSSNITQNFNGIIYGDANGSYSPGIKTITTNQQGIISIEPVNDANSEISVPIHISEMSNLGAFQFTIQYDADKLTFTGADHWLNGVQDVTVGYATPGQLTFVWVADDQGINITEGILCDLWFTTKTSGQSILSFESYPTDKEFSDYEGNLFEPEYVNGIIGSTTGIGEQNRTDISVYPNPSNGTFTLELKSVQSQNFDVKIYNSLGVAVYQQLNVAANNKYSREIGSGDLPEGIYTLTVTGKDTNYIKKIVIRK